MNSLTFSPSALSLCGQLLGQVPWTIGVVAECDRGVVSKSLEGDDAE